MTSEHFWEIPADIDEFDGYQAGTNFEADVAQLVAAISTFMSTGVNRDEVMDALECVTIWFEQQEESPQQMGWVGGDGRP